MQRYGWTARFPNFFLYLIKKMRVKIKKDFPNTEGLKQGDVIFVADQHTKVDSNMYVLNSSSFKKVNILDYPEYFEIMSDPKHKDKINWTAILDQLKYIMENPAQRLNDFDIKELMYKKLLEETYGSELPKNNSYQTHKFYYEAKV